MEKSGKGQVCGGKGVKQKTRVHFSHVNLEKSVRYPSEDVEWLTRYVSVELRDVRKFGCYECMNSISNYRNRIERIEKT